MPRSLGLRMLSVATLWVAISLIAAAFVLQNLFAVNVERTAKGELSASLNRLLAELAPGSETPQIAQQLPEPLYSSPFSGRYWQIEALDNGRLLRSRSLWDVVLPGRNITVADGEVFYREVGPEGQTLLAVSRAVAARFEQRERTFLITVARDVDVLDAARQQFIRDMMITLAVLGLAIVAAAWLLVRIGLWPLKRVRRGVAEVRRGAAERLEGTFPAELDPLVEEVNALLTARETAMEKARARAADLAHGLKTPLAALQGVAGRLRDKGDNRDADLVDTLVGEMSERIDYQMRLATLRIPAHSTSTSLNTAVLRALAVLKKTAIGERLHWLAELAADAAVDIHRQDLLELVGIILENAAQWADRQVRLRSSHDGDCAVLLIADDGPGIPEDKLAGLGVRGQRLDETRPGTGLGLAIAGEIVSLNGGSMTFARAEEGGLEVTLRLVLARN